MLSDRKILVTGPAGQIAFPLVEELARDNEVWGIARFGDPGTRERVEKVGVTTAVVDLADPDFSPLPSRFDHVLHFAIFQTSSLDYDHAMRVNAEGTGLLMDRFHEARSCLVVSSTVVYDINEDPTHELAEGDPLGDSRQPYSRPYPMTKIAQEGVARTMARLRRLPTTIARMNVSYGPNGGMPAYQLDQLVAGQPVSLLSGGPTLYNPIEQADINAQVPKLLEVASVPATIVNWAGDDVVQSEDWLRYLGELIGVEPEFVYDRVGICSRPCDNSRRRALIGDCSVGWREGMRRMAETRHPDRVLA
jgi:nucleoside-diphosphate-sugar epimerase